MTDSFKIVSSRLFNTFMGIDTCISGSTCEILAIAPWNVLSFRVLEAFGQTEINDEYVVFRMFRSSDQKVVWFDISMNYSLLMNLLNTLKHLDSDHENGFQVKLSLTRLKQIF